MRHLFPGSPTIEAPLPLRPCVLVLARYPLRRHGPAGNPMSRRKYTKHGRRCQDCGRDWKPTTEVTFWATGMKYSVCGECIDAYRAVILKP